MKHRKTNSPPSRQVELKANDVASMLDIAPASITAPVEDPKLPPVVKSTDPTLPAAPALEEVPTPCGAEPSQPLEPSPATEQSASLGAEPDIFEFLSPGHPLSDSQPPLRPGITNQTLRANPLPARGRRGGTGMNRYDPRVGLGVESSTVIAFLPPAVRNRLAACPTAGTGVHDWLFLAALALARAGVESKTAAQLIRDSSEDCGRFVDGREINEAIRNAYRLVGLEADGSISKQPRPPVWPSRNLEQIEAIGAKGTGLAGLEELSRVRFTSNDRHTEEIIDILFPNDPLLCCGVDKNKFATRFREEWRGGLASMPFIVPSPMSERKGITTTGKVSQRALTNTGPRRYLAVEFDFAERDMGGHDTKCGPMLRTLGEQGITVLDLCASVLQILAQYAPLALVVFSGGKSLHGWFYCHGQAEDQVRRFMNYAVSLGADPATWTRCQMVRMPDGTRADGNGGRQTVHYFNPEVLHVA